MEAIQETDGGGAPQTPRRPPPSEKAASGKALEPSEGWQEERLIDDGGEEIFIRYKGDASLQRYEYIRDYLDFKIKRMKRA